MIRVVIDSSVVISAAFRDRKPEELILLVVESKDHEWIVSSSILKEYNEVLARKKFGLPAEILFDWRERFQSFTTLVEPVVTVDFERDPKDAIFLECAIAGEADYLITGDTDFEDAVTLAKSKIISVSRFLDSQGLLADRGTSGGSSDDDP
jgi:uncharacterized protein